MKKFIKKIISDKSLLATILLIFILVAGFLVLQKSYSLNEIVTKESGYATRTLYKNQYFIDNENMSDTILSDNATGTKNIEEEKGPGGSVFIGFANSVSTSPIYTTILGAAQGDNDSPLYSIYKFNVIFEKGDNVSEIGSTSANCKVSYEGTSCDVKLPSITPVSSEYVPVGWSTTKGDSTGTPASSNYAVSSNNLKLYANAKALPKYTIHYISEAGGRITGITSEQVAENHTPAGSTVEPPEGFETLGWQAIDENGDEYIEVTLKDGSKITPSVAMPTESVKNIDVTHSFILKAVFGSLRYTIGNCYWDPVGADGVLHIYNKTGTSCTLDKVTKGHTPWASQASKITSVVVGEGVIAAEDSSWLFSNLPNVTTIDLRNFDTTGVKDMSHMFENDTNLTSILFPNNFVTSEVTDINSMFKNCSSLESIDLSSFNTSNVTDMSSLFEGCSKLSDIDLSKLDTTNVVNISNIFEGCDRLDKEKMKALNINGDNITTEITFQDDNPKVTLNEDDENKTITIDKPISGGSGLYDYQIDNIQPSTDGITIENGKVHISDSVPSGTYIIRIKVIDEISGTYQFITYTVEIKQNVISDPEKPGIKSNIDNLIYQSQNIIINCESNTNYDEGISKKFYYGISNDSMTIPTDWTEIEDNMVTIEKEKQQVGTKYYFCRERAVKGNKVSNPSDSGPLAITITNAKITFNTDMGGKIVGTSPLYVRFGEGGAYTNLTGSNSSIYPTALRSGYSFNGWFTTITGGQKIINARRIIQNNTDYTSESGNWIITEPVTLYAQYTKNNGASDSEDAYYGKISKLNVYLNTYSSVSLSWTKVNDATGYELCYKKSSSKTYKCNYNASLKGINLDNGTKYDFKVTPYRKMNGKYVVSPNSKTVSIYTLKKMDKPKVKKNSKTKVKVTINQINGATGYEIYTSKKKGSGYKLVKKIGYTKKSVNLKVKRKKKLYYKVRAYKVDNNKKIYAPYSKIKSYKLK